MWRINDLIYRPEHEVLQELEQHRNWILSGTPGTQQTKQTTPDATPLTPPTGMSTLESIAEGQQKPGRTGESSYDDDGMESDEYAPETSGMNDVEDEKDYQEQGNGEKPSKVGAAADGKTDNMQLDDVRPNTDAQGSAIDNATEAVAPPTIDTQPAVAPEGEDASNNLGKKRPLEGSDIEGQTLTKS